jgi:hypothetical protein
VPHVYPPFHSTYYSRILADTVRLASLSLETVGFIAEVFVQDATTPHLLHLVEAFLVSI